MNSGRSLATWSTPSVGSSLATSCRTAVSASPRTPVRPAHISDFTWEDKNLLRTNLCDDRERTLVGLTSFVTRNPPMLPKLDRKRALFVLGKIDEILDWEQSNEADKDTK